MEVIRINNKQQLLKNLRDLDTKLENREISKKEYKALKKNYQEKIESIEVIERIRKMQGNTKPYVPETVKEETVSTEATKATDKEIIQKYITKPQPKTEILEQSKEDEEGDKSLLKKYLKPENEETREEKLNRPKLNDPEDEALIKKFITDPTSKREVNTKNNSKEELDKVAKLKYVKPTEKDDKTSKEPKSPEDRKETILSIISSFGKKTNESPKEEKSVESTKPPVTESVGQVDETKPVSKPPVTESVGPVDGTKPVSKPPVTESVGPVDGTKPVSKPPVTEKAESVNVSETTSEPSMVDATEKVDATKQEEISEKVEKTSTPTKEPKKERPKLKESIIVNSEDILKPKKDKEPIPIKEVSSILDDSSPKPKPKENINVSSKEVSDAISYAMGESTSILKIDDIKEQKTLKETSKSNDNLVTEQNTDDSEIKSFFGFKVGSDKPEPETEINIDELNQSKSFLGVKLDKESSPKEEKPHKKPVFSDSVKDSVLNAKPEKDKKPKFNEAVKDPTTKKVEDKTISNKTESEKNIKPPLSQTRASGFKSEDSNPKKEVPIKTMNSTKPVFAVKSKDDLLNSEKLKTENRPKIDTTKSISDFKKDKESKSKTAKTDDKTKNVDSQTIYPTNKKDKSKEKSSVMTSSDVDKPSSDDEDKRQKILLGGLILGIILLIVALFGISAYMSPSDTTLYIDDTALAPNNTDNLTNTTDYSLTNTYASASSSSANTVYRDTDTNNDYKYTNYGNYRHNSTYSNSNSNASTSNSSSSNNNNNNNNSNHQNSNNNNNDDPSSDKPSSDGPSNKTGNNANKTTKK